MRMLGLSIANVVHWLCIGVGNPLLKHDTVNSALSNAIKLFLRKATCSAQETVCIHRYPIFSTLKSVHIIDLDGPVLPSEIKFGTEGKPKVPSMTRYLPIATLLSVVLAMIMYWIRRSFEE